MSEHDRFVAFLRRVAAEYHAPPPTPRESIWEVIEVAIDSDAPAARDPLEPSLARAVADYRSPPEAPREEMWARIEGAWRLRRAAPPAAREAGLETLPPPFVPLDVETAIDERSRPGHARRGWAGWAAGVGIAASLAIGFVVGRGTTPTENPATTDGVVALEDAPSSSRPGAPADNSPVPGPGAESVPEADASASTSVDPLTRLARRGGDADVATDAGGAARPPEPTALERRRRTLGYAVSNHMKRADALLTAFEQEPADDALGPAVSQWADELLSETRLLLELPVQRRDASTTALLQELELILAQIALLNGDAGATERALIAEALERGTVSRLRAASRPSTPAGT